MKCRIDGRKYYAATVGGHVWQHDRQLLDEAEAFVGKIEWLQE